MVKVNKEAYIPLLPYDLGYEETIIQLIKSLDCLDKVVECVYRHVKDNINKQKSEIVKLNSKLNNIKDQVHRLSDTKKSVQVFSSSKYPAAHCHKDYEYSYDFNIKSEIVENVQVTHQICSSRNPSDKLKFYSVNNEDKEISVNKDNLQIKGLGNLPEDVTYINSLLLFNSNENLYKNYVLSNPYQVNITANKHVENLENTNKPVFTLPLNNTENQFNYSYTPVYEEVPIIDVPEDLPDLPGIAGDVQCFQEVENYFVEEPIIFKPSNVVDLPTLDELDHFKNNEVLADDSSIKQETIIPDPKQLSSTTVECTQNKIDHIDDDINIVKNNQNINQMNNDNFNTHSVLMDEIRNAGGLKKAKLRSVGDRKTGGEVVPTGDDLMADLHKKLAMRRQGISGNNKQNDTSLQGVIYRMASTMLPPDPESENEPDGDNDTENDWDD